jgi:hypothetical protein
MGTRNLTLVRLGGKYKVAQYGQYDGYPEAVGAGIVEVLKTYPREQIETAIAACAFATPDDIETRWAAAHAREDLYVSKWPWLSRSCAGDDLLRLLMGETLRQPISRSIWRGPVDVIRDQRAFAKDGLFCEYCYLIDFDRNVFEIYISGSHAVEGTVPPEFEDNQNGDGYHPVKLAGTWPIDELPSVDQMDKACEKIMEGAA